MLRRLLGREPAELHRTSNTLTTLAMVSIGVGYALVPQNVGHIAVLGIVLRALDCPPPPLRLLLLHRTVDVAPAVHAFVALVEAMRSDTLSDEARPALDGL